MPLRDQTKYIYTCGFRADEKDSYPAQIMETNKNGLLHIRFDDGVDYWAFPEEVKEIS